LLLAGAFLGCGMLAHSGIVFTLVPFAIVVLLSGGSGRASPRRRLAAGAGGVLILSWSAYQRFIDPPGNRLMKWHLAGVDPDRRPHVVAGDPGQLPRHTRTHSAGEPGEQRQEPDRGLAAGGPAVTAATCCPNCGIWSTATS